MSRNKLYNMSYFCKRLVENGFDVNRLRIPYMSDDIRKWSVVVNKQGSEYKHNILITCFKNEETKEFIFKFQGQSAEDFMLPTQTMTLIIEILEKAMNGNGEIYE